MSVSILMGSESDKPIAERAFNLLEKHHVPCDMQVVSAHRNPDRLREIVVHSSSKVFIAFAGGAAHLAGAIAAQTLKPVIGVPVCNTAASLGGMDSLLATVQMPRGVPVATVAINGAENAAILAMQILAVGMDRNFDVIHRELKEMRKEWNK